MCSRWFIFSLYNVCYQSQRNCGRRSTAAGRPWPAKMHRVVPLKTMLQFHRYQGYGWKCIELTIWRTCIQVSSFCITNQFLPRFYNTKYMTHDNLAYSNAKYQVFYNRTNTIFDWSDYLKTLLITEFNLLLRYPILWMLT